MYTTRQIAELISLQASEWTKLGTRGTLPIIDAVNREMKSGNVQANEYVEPTTGLPPLLTTTAGTFQYDLPDNAQRCMTQSRKTPAIQRVRFGSGVDSHIAIL